MPTATKTAPTEAPAGTVIAAPPVAELPPLPGWLSFAAKPEAIAKPKSILLYGMPGTRKTTIASTIALVPGFERVLIIDVDNGTEVLRNDPELWERVKDGRIVIIPISSLDPLAKGKIDAIVKDITTCDLGFNAVVFDTLDVGQDVSEDAAEVKFATSAKGQRDGFAVYREIGKWTSDTARALHECPWFTAIFTAHAKEQTKDSGAYRVLPTLSGSSKDSIGGVFSIVAYLEYQNHPQTGERHLFAHLGESENFITKNRYRLPSAMVDLTMPQLYSAIEASTASSSTVANAA